MRNLNINSKATGLKINSEKTKLLRLNTTNNEKVQVDDQDIDDVESFVYLGALVSTSGTEDDIKARLGKARTTYSKLGTIWKNSQLTSKNKIKIFQHHLGTVVWLRNLESDSNGGEKVGYVPTQEPSPNTKDPLANAYNQRGDMEKNGDRNDQQTGGKEEMGVVRPRPQNGSQLTSKNCTRMGTGRQKEEGSTAGDVAQNCGKGAQELGQRQHCLRQTG